ncbi:M48 family metallopeptidase [Nocardioides mesophilus]|uniref:M48 family metallopeptidase n=2 Tax=Nocardioides mesophilus TaxID=433659 RepID=A0A7G9RGM8_9ACTN|nr:M48 family metallopeptidase [Nocardioides mesophilus]
MAALATLALVVVAALWVPWSWVPGGRLVPLSPGDLFTKSELARAERFSDARRWLGWTSYAVSLATAAALGFTRWGARLVRRLEGGRRWPVTAVLAVGAVLLIGRLVTLPLSLLLRRLGLEYGLTDQAFTGWLRDLTVSFLVSWVATSILVLLMIFFARWRPRTWFVWAGGTAAVVAVAGSFLYPIVVEPLFNNFTSMPDGPLRTSILRLAETEGVRVSDVLVADASRRTTTLNAYVSGFGSTRRVVVYDTLLQAMTPAEARVVIAHELAHAKHDDVLVGTLMGALGAIAGVAVLALLLDSRRLQERSGSAGTADPRSIPLVLALAAVGSLLSSPAVNAVSRSIEIRADRDSLAATGADAAFIDMQRQLSLRALHDPTPPAWSQWLFGSHPTVLERAGLPSSLAEAGK